MTIDSDSRRVARASCRVSRPDSVMDIEDARTRTRAIAQEHANRNQDLGSEDRALQYLRRVRPLDRRPYAAERLLSPDPGRDPSHLDARLCGEDSIPRAAIPERRQIPHPLHRCNNTKLGKINDPHFIAFVNAVALHLRSQLMLPPTFSVRGRPQSILRSLIGHIAAQGVDRYPKGPMTEAIRDYFLDETLPLPSGLNAFYWAYPFQSHVMARDVSYLDLTGGTPFAMWFLKFFPVAFMITWDRQGNFEYPTHTFEPWRRAPFDAEVELPLSLRGIPHPLWPETPTDRSVILYGQEAIHVTRK
jgi:hypothetical protein